MAKWHVTPGTEGNTMSGYINYDENGYHQEITQDITSHVEYAKQAKEELANSTMKKRLGGYRKMATIPDIVALRILQDHNLDIHAPQFTKDPNNIKKLKYILATEYQDLLIST